MENKKLGTLLIILSIFILILFTSYTSQINNQSVEMGCFPNKNCKTIEKMLSLSHISMGIFSFLFALGFYLLFFNKTEKAILERLEKEKELKVEDMKFKILMKALDPFEQKVIEAIKEQEGITQNTLRLRVNMSKAKLSYVLQELEKRGLIKRIEKGKTLAIYLRI
ncbi:MAG: winged helix-turn-helix transcriptional regulator [Nanoarchaeota archaeon]|nr:winged helix-turn-helix transcriptional regulator [Nanoarchaeota archaeon]